MNETILPSEPDDHTMPETSPTSSFSSPRRANLRSNSNASYSLNDGTQNRSSQSDIRFDPSSSDMWRGNMNSELEFLWKKSWQTLMCSKWHKFSYSNTRVYEKALLKILSQELSQVFIGCDNANTSLSFMTNNEEQNMTAESEVICYEVVNCIIEPLSPNAWPPTSRPPLSASPPNVSHDQPTQTHTPLIVSVNIEISTIQQQQQQPYETKLIWIPIREQKYQHDTSVKEMPLILAYGLPPVISIITKWWQRQFNCSIQLRNWDHWELSEIFKGWANLILTHTMQFTDIKETINLKYKLPRQISAMDYITVRPEIMKLITCARPCHAGNGDNTSDLVVSKDQTNVLSVLHQQFLCYFRIRLDRCQLVHMRLDTLYLNCNGQIELMPTKYGNLSLYILDQMAFLIGHTNNMDASRKDTL
ncbi:hypothetical protein BDF19DRAFT_430184 [Syncephalis fuscata]|nr:hypothetical protein BDF19DRAFT_430184 [Syncephalis fuscata]